MYLARKLDAWETPCPQSRQRKDGRLQDPPPPPKAVVENQEKMIQRGEMMGFFDDLSSTSVSLTRLGRGSFVWHHPAEPPARPLLLFESEVCPFSRKVRETLSELDLEYVSYPTARGSQHREKLKELGGKKLFPFLMDPNTGRRVYEAEEIINYLCEQYGRGRGLLSHLQAPFQTANALFSSSLRQKGASVRRGLERRPHPKEFLVLYQYEGSPFCRQVREILHELDLPCWIKNVARGSMRRAELLRLSGKIEVPFLLDTNTDTSLFGTDTIQRYLLDNYGPSAAGI